MEAELKMVPVGKYMQAQEQPRPKGWSTSIYRVYSMSGGELGEIRWYPAWRQYVFRPASYSIYSAGCMKELIAFIEGIKKQSALRGE